MLFTFHSIVSEIVYAEMFYYWTWRWEKCQWSDQNVVLIFDRLSLQQNVLLSTYYFIYLTITYISLINSFHHSILVVLQFYIKKGKKRGDTHTHTKGKREVKRSNTLHTHPQNTRLTKNKVQICSIFYNVFPVYCW